MSVPLEPDFVVIQLGSTGATPTYTNMCGIETSGINRVANTTDRFRRDCDKPGEVPTRNVRVTGRQWDMTGSGVLNMEMIEEYTGALGISRPYRMLYGQRDGTDEGVIYGYYTGPAVMTSFNENVGEDGAVELNFAGENWPTWTIGEPT